MDVFSAFPNAIIYGVWQISQYQEGSLVGSVWDADSASDLDVIIDEGDNTNVNAGSNPQALDADLLLYVKPSQLPTLNPRALASGYLVYDSENDDYFAIIRADIGKNQDAGDIEHVELFLRQTDATLIKTES